MGCMSEYDIKTKETRYPFMFAYQELLSKGGCNEGTWSPSSLDLVFH